MTSRRVETGPLSEWDLRRSQEVLSANGFGETNDEWRRAADHPHGLIRVAALYLLTRQPDPVDEKRLRRAMDDIDESVMALAAFGLVMLGHTKAKEALEAVARLDVDAFRGATLAAGLLGELGDATAYQTILRGMGSEHGATRLWTLKNAKPFVQLHGVPQSGGKGLDVWALYDQALADRFEAVRSEARAQLSELNVPEAESLLATRRTTPSENLPGQ